MVSLLIHLLNGSANRLAQAYGSQFTLTGLALPEIGILLGLACGLGLAGAWLPVGQSLRKFD